MAKKSILEGGARQNYGMCLGDKCDNPASKMTSFSGFGDLKLYDLQQEKMHDVKKKKTDTVKKSEQSTAEYDPKVIHFAPLCKGCAEKVQKRGGRVAPLTKKTMETWNESEANRALPGDADHPLTLNPKYKKKEASTDWTRSSATKGGMGGRDHIQEYLNWKLNEADPSGARGLDFSLVSGNKKIKDKKRKTIREIDSALHKKVVSERRTPEQKEALLSRQLEHLRSGKLEQTPEESPHKEANLRYLQDTMRIKGGHKASFNQKSSEDNSFLQAHMRRTNRDYYFRKGEKKEKPIQEPKPKYVNPNKVRGGKAPVKSGDIMLTGRQAAYERSLDPRLESIEKEYAAKKAAKAARIAGKQFNPPTMVVRGGN